MFSSLFSCALLILILFSCNSRNHNSTISENHSFQNLVFFEKLDSIQIDFLGNPTVHDLNPTYKTVVFMEHRQSSEEIFIADFSGVILSSFSKFGDMPDTYGRQLSTIRIVDNNSFLVYGYNGFITYSFKGSVQSLVKHENFQVPSQSMIAMGFGMEKLGDLFLSHNQAQPPTDIELLKSFPLLSVLDPKKGIIKPIITFPKQSVFTSGKHFFMRSWFPVYEINRDHIYVVFGSEPIINVYKKDHPFEFLKSIPINLRNYSFFKGSEEIDFNQLFGMSIISGRIENIKKIDNYFLVAYFPGYDQQDTQTNFENKSPEESKLFRERMKRKYPSRLAIIDSIGNVIKDFIPDGLEPSSMLLRDGQLWMMEKPNEEEEQDYFRLFRVGLKIENHGEN